MYIETMWFKKNRIDLKQLEQLEQALNIKLPDFFLRFYSEEVKLINKFKKLSNDEDFIGLTTDFDWMIEYNRDFLQLPKTEGLCKHKICIGTDGCGNDSFISLETKDTRVFKVDHEIADDLLDDSTDDFNWEDERMEKYDSLRHYLKEEIKVLKEFRS